MKDRDINRDTYSLDGKPVEEDDEFLCTAEQGFHCTAEDPGMRPAERIHPDATGNKIVYGKAVLRKNQKNQKDPPPRHRGLYRVAYCLAWLCARIAKIALWERPWWVPALIVLFILIWMAKYYQ